MYLALFLIINYSLFVRQFNKNNRCFSSIEFLSQLDDNVVWDTLLETTPLVSAEQTTK